MFQAAAHVARLCAGHLIIASAKMVAMGGFQFVTHAFNIADNQHEMNQFLSGPAQLEFKPLLICHHTEH